MMLSFREKIKRFAALSRERGTLTAFGRGLSRILPLLYAFVEDHLSGGAIAGRTRRQVAVADLAIEGSHGMLANRYEATPTPMLIFWLIRRLLPKDRSDWSFIDIGAGKGRMVAVAASQGFHSAIGIELASDLCVEGNRILSEFGLFRTGEVEIRQEDATQFALPARPCIFFLFNPFHDIVMEKFLDHVVASHAANPRPLLFVYLNPIWSSRFETHAALKAVQPGRMTAAIFETLSPWRVRLFEVV